MALGHLLVFAALSFPELGDGFWALLSSRRTGDMFVEVFVAPDGQVDDCTVLYSEFSSEEGDRICNQVRQKEVAAPAHDQHGEAVYSTAIFRFSTTLGRDADQRVIQRDPIMDVGVSQLPSGFDDRLYVGLKVLIGENGMIEHCETNTRPADAYTRIACEQAAMVPQVVRYDRQGSAVRHVTDIGVVFMTN